MMMNINNTVLCLDMALFYDYMTKNIIVCGRNCSAVIVDFRCFK